MAVGPFKIRVHLGRLLLVFFGPMHAGVALFVALGRVVIAAFLCPVVRIVLLGLLLVLLALLVAVYRRSVGGSPDDDACRVGCLANSRLGLLRHAQGLGSDVVGDEVGRIDGSLLLFVGDLGLGVGHVVGVRLQRGAVHGVDALGYDDDERCAHEDAGAEQRNGAQLARRQRKGEREDAGEKGAGLSERLHTAKEIFALTQHP